MNVSQSTMSKLFNSGSCILGNVQKATHERKQTTRSNQTTLKQNLFSKRLPVQAKHFPKETASVGFEPGILGSVDRCYAAEPNYFSSSLDVRTWL